MHACIWYVQHNKCTVVAFLFRFKYAIRFDCWSPWCLYSLLKDGLRDVIHWKWPILHQGVRTECRPAAVTMVTGVDGKTRYLVRSRANWTFLDTSSDCYPETGSRIEDAHTSSQPIPLCSHTCHNYTGHDLPWGKKKRWRSREVKQSGFVQGTF